MNNSIDWLLKERVIQHICEKCGSDFDKPCSCEECLDDEGMQAMFDYELKKAKKIGEEYFMHKG